MPILLGDSAYPLGWFCIPNLKNVGHREEKYKFFNYIHSSTRMTIERAFGRLKGRWRILLGNVGILLKFSDVAQTIHACVVLHNFVERRNQSVGLDEAHLEVEDFGPNDNHACAVHGRPPRVTMAERAREGLVDYINVHCDRYRRTN
mmetsp:Transcript_4139/g.8496  ORF Transcript_4139/g.8496 Transcript_4139/m.8496 type:complete len:147 (-) Transcript_4139:108-548(-)